MSNDKMDSSTVYALFEEIKNKLNECPKREQSAPVPSLDPEDVEKIELLSKKLDKVGEKLDEPVKHTHSHTIDLMSNKILTIFAVVIVALIVSLWIVRNQWDTIKQFRDNDLKYRYIQMKGQATPDDILMLREVFDYNRRPDSIKVIRQRVGKYEQLIQEESERQSRIKLDAE